MPTASACSPPEDSAETSPFLLKAAKRARSNCSGPDAFMIWTLCSCLQHACTHHELRASTNPSHACMHACMHSVGAPCTGCRSHMGIYSACPPCQILAARPQTSARCALSTRRPTLWVLGECRARIVRGVASPSLSTWLSNFLQAPQYDVQAFQRQRQQHTYMPEAPMLCCTHNSDLQ